MGRRAGEEVERTKGDRRREEEGGGRSSDANLVTHSD